MPRPCHPVLASLLLAFPLSLATAQPQADTARLGDLVVTATRLETPRRSLTASVTVVTGAELRERGFRFLSDWLREVSGVTVVEGGSLGSVTSLFLRGGESDYVKLLVDGVAVNQPGGSLNLAHLGTTDIERIEVVRGPASVLYGSDAMTGVIQVFTRRGGRGGELAVTARGGSFGTSDLRARVAGGSSRLGWSAGGSRFGSRGTYAYNSAYENWEADARLTARPGAGTDLALAARWGDAEAHFPTDFAGVPSDSNQFTRDRGLTLSLDAGQRLSSRVELRMLASLFDTWARFQDTPDGVEDNLGYGFDAVRQGDVNRQTIDLRANLRATDGVTVSGGVETWREAQQLLDSTTSDFGGGPFVSVDRFEADRSNVAAYAQVLAELSPALDLQAGVRWDGNEVFGGFATWRAGAVFRPVAWLHLRGAAGSAFKQPTFSEQFARTAFEVGNPALTPERALSWEAAGEADLLDGRLTLSASWFQQRFEDLIAYLPAEPGEPTYANVGRATARGLELDARLTPVPTVTVSAGWTRLTTRVDDPGAGGGYQEGDELLRRPASMVRGGVAWRPRGAVVAVDLLLTGSRDDLDYREFPATRVTLPAFMLVNASTDLPLETMSPSLPERIALTLQVQNLLDESYESVIGFPGRGRMVLVGVRLGR